jgi:hypothetical protein
MARSDTTSKFKNGSPSTDCNSHNGRPLNDSYWVPYDFALSYRSSSFRTNTKSALFSP